MKKEENDTRWNAALLSDLGRSMSHRTLEYDLESRLMHLFNDPLRLRELLDERAAEPWADKPERLRSMPIVAVGRQQGLSASWRSRFEEVGLAMISHEKAVPFEPTPEDVIRAITLPAESDQK